MENVEKYRNSEARAEKVNAEFLLNHLQERVGSEYQAYVRAEHADGVPVGMIMPAYEWFRTVYSDQALASEIRKLLDILEG